MPYTPVECRAKVARLHAPEKVFLLHCRMQLFPALPPVVRGMFRRPEALAVCPPGGAPRERGMFLNQTANYGLSQWEATDRILMENFNSDNSKIDAALEALSSTRNCRVYTTSYTGTGTGKNSFTFPAKPLAVMVMGSGIWLCVLQGQAIGQSRNGRTSSDYVDVTWSGNSVTWTVENDTALQCNSKGTKYTLVALLQV